MHDGVSIEVLSQRFFVSAIVLIDNPNPLMRAWLMQTKIFNRLGDITKCPEGYVTQIGQ